jgi:hypothetical protein
MINVRIRDRDLCLSWSCEHIRKINESKKLLSSFLSHVLTKKKKKTFKYRDFNEPHRIEFEYEIIKICLGIHLFIFMSLVR